MVYEQSANELCEDELPGLGERRIVAAHGGAETHGESKEVFISEGAIGQLLAQTFFAFVSEPQSSVTWPDTESPSAGYLKQSFSNSSIDGYFTA